MSAESDRGRATGPLAAGVAGTFWILALSVLGLLCLRLDVYDDSAMMLGARLVRAGEKPYVDFYTHYGPLTYDILALFSRIPGNPAVILRLAQSVLFLLTCAALIWLARRQSQPRLLFVASVPIAALAISAVFQLPAFVAFFLCFTALCLIAALAAASTATRGLLAAVGGFALGSAALVRPAFAGYGAVAILVLFLFLRSGGETWIGLRGFALVGGAAVATLLGLWLLLYHSIPPATFWRAAVEAPAHLVGSGTRFLRPDFFPAFSPRLGSSIVTAVGAAVIFAATLVWLLASSSSRRWLLAGLFAAVAGGLASVLLHNPAAASHDAGLISGIWFGLAAGLVALRRREILADRSLRAAAPLGLTSTAFAHYFWARPDRPHLVPLLALAVTAAALVLPAQRPRRRVAAALLFLAAYVALWRIPWAPFPAMHLFHGGVTRILQHARAPHADWRSLWPAGEIPADAVGAVALADRHADPKSRFVAVASSQTQSSGDPILLFLLSRRQPYTKWWAYDPGVQSSAAIQSIMLTELRESGSETAIVWPVERYLYEPPQSDPRIPSKFDLAFDRLYPRRAAVVGSFEIRVHRPPSPRLRAVDSQF